MGTSVIIFKNNIMGNSNSNNGSGGIGFFGVLAIVFIVLKLVGTITWSWWWVTAPLWGGFVLVVLTILIVVLMGWLSKRM